MAVHVSPLQIVTAEILAGMQSIQFTHAQSLREEWLVIVFASWRLATGTARNVACISPNSWPSIAFVNISSQALYNTVGRCVCANNQATCVHTLGYKKPQNWTNSSPVTTLTNWLSRGWMDCGPQGTLALSPGAKGIVGTFRVWI